MTAQRFSKALLYNKENAPTNGVKEYGDVSLMTFELELELLFILAYFTFSPLSMWMNTTPNTDEDDTSQGAEYVNSLTRGETFSFETCGGSATVYSKKEKEKKDVGETKEERCTRTTTTTTTALFFGLRKVTPLWEFQVLALAIIPATSSRFGSPPKKQQSNKERVCYTLFFLSRPSYHQRSDRSSVLRRACGHIFYLFIIYLYLIVVGHFRIYIYIYIFSLLLRICFSSTARGLLESCWDSSNLHTQVTTFLNSTASSMHSRTSAPWRRAALSCRGLVNRLLYPRPCHTAPRWVRNTFAFSQGELPRSSPLYRALHATTMPAGVPAAAGVGSSSGDIPTRGGGSDTAAGEQQEAAGVTLRPFKGSLYKFQSKLAGTAGGVVVLFHLRKWNGGDPRGKPRDPSPTATAVARDLGMEISEDEEEMQWSRAATARPAPADVSPHDTASGSGFGSPTVPEPEAVSCWSVEANRHIEICAMFDIRCLPTWLGFRDGILVGRVEGGSEPELLKLVKAVREPPPNRSLSRSEKDLNTLTDTSAGGVGILGTHARTDMVALDEASYAESEFLAQTETDGHPPTRLQSEPFLIYLPQSPPPLLLPLLYCRLLFLISSCFPASEGAAHTQLYSYRVFLRYPFLLFGFPSILSRVNERNLFSLAERQGAQKELEIELHTNKRYVSNICAMCGGSQCPAGDHSLLSVAYQILKDGDGTSIAQSFPFYIPLPPHSFPGRVEAYCADCVQLSDTVGTPPPPSFCIARQLFVVVYSSQINLSSTDSSEEDHFSPPQECICWLGAHKAETPHVRYTIMEPLEHRPGGPRSPSTSPRSSVCSHSSTSEEWEGADEDRRAEALPLPPHNAGNVAGDIHPCSSREGNEEEGDEWLNEDESDSFPVLPPQVAPDPAMEGDRGGEDLMREELWDQIIDNPALHDAIPRLRRQGTDRHRLHHHFHRRNSDAVPLAFPPMGMSVPPPPPPPPPPSPPITGDCWVCTLSTNTPENRLISGVCRCKGSAGVVHQDCIDDLVIRYNFHRCAACKSQYRLVYPANKKAILRAPFTEKCSLVCRVLLWPLLRRAMCLVFWIIFSFGVVPYQVGGVFYRRQLQEENISAASWWWLRFYAWLLGSAIGAVVRAVAVSWWSWSSTLLHHQGPAEADVTLEDIMAGGDGQQDGGGRRREAADGENEAVEQQLAHLNGEVRTVFACMHSVEKWVGRKNIETLTLLHVSVGTAIALVLSLRQWAMLAVVLFLVCAVWSLLVPKYTFTNRKRMFEEIEAWKATMTYGEALNLFALTCMRIASIIFSSSASIFVLHVLFAPYLFTSSTFGEVVDEITILRLLLYGLAGFLFLAAGVSAFDKMYTSPLFAHGVDLFLFHATQPTEDLHRHFVEALAARAHHTNALQLLLGTFYTLVPLLLTTVAFFVVPFVVVCSARSAIWGDTFVTASTERRDALFGWTNIRLIDSAAALEAPQPGQVHVPLSFGFPQLTPAAFFGPLSLIHWAKHIQHHYNLAGHVLGINVNAVARSTTQRADSQQVARQDLESTTPLKQLVREATSWLLSLVPAPLVLLSEELLVVLKDATRAGRLCEMAWEGLIVRDGIDFSADPFNKGDAADPTASSSSRSTVGDEKGRHTEVFETFTTYTHTSDSSTVHCEVTVNGVKQKCTSLGDGRVAAPGVSYEANTSTKAFSMKRRREMGDDGDSVEHTVSNIGIEVSRDGSITVTARHLNTNTSTAPGNNSTHKMDGEVGADKAAKTAAANAPPSTPAVKAMNASTQGSAAPLIVHTPPLHLLSDFVKTDGSVQQYRPHSPLLTCEVVYAVLLFSLLDAPDSVVEDTPWSWLQTMVRASFRIRWWCADVILRHPMLPTWANNTFLLFLLCTACYCIASLPFYHASLRILYRLSGFYARMLGLEEFLFTDAGRANMEAFLNGPEELTEVFVPDPPLEALFLTRDEMMEKQRVPRHLHARCTIFFVFYYLSVTLLLWSMPILGSILFASLTTQLVPLVSVSVCFLFFLWRPKYVLHDAALRALVLILSAIFIVVSLLLVQPVQFLYSIKPNSLLVSCYMTENKLRPKVERLFYVLSLAQELKVKNKTKQPNSNNNNNNNNNKKNITKVSRKFGDPINISASQRIGLSLSRLIHVGWAALHRHSVVAPPLCCCFGCGSTNELRWFSSSCSFDQYKCYPSLYLSILVLCKKPCTIKVRHTVRSRKIMRRCPSRALSSGLAAAVAAVPHESVRSAGGCIRRLQRGGHRNETLDSPHMGFLMHGARSLLTLSRSFTSRLDGSEGEEERAATAAHGDWAPLVEVELMEGSATESSAARPGSGGSASPQKMELDSASGAREMVKLLDAFAKAKVINFVKRLRDAEGQVEVLPPDDADNGQQPLIETRDVAGSDGQQQFYARVRLPLPAAYGTGIYGEGFAPTEREAEIAACMHAERIIDALGFPIFQLSSKQKRHAEAAAAAGRWAPQPGATPLEPSKELLDRLPAPIQYTNRGGGGATAKVEQQMRLDKVAFTAVRRGAFTPLKHTLVSAYFFDGGSVQRLKQFLFAYKSSLERSCKVTALHKEAAKFMGGGGGGSSEGSIPTLFIAQLRLPIDARFGERVCCGKAPTRREAIALACMHAELTIDALGLMLYPQSPEEQQQHAKECRQVQRWCVEPGDFDFRYTVPSPPPLELEGDREMSTVSSVLQQPPPGSRQSNPAGGTGTAAAGSTSTATAGGMRSQAAIAEVVGEGAGAGGAPLDGDRAAAAMPSIESLLVQHSRAVNNMHGVLDTTTVESSAKKLLRSYLLYAVNGGSSPPSEAPPGTEASAAAEARRKAVEEPFFVESLGQRQQETYRATVSVPLLGPARGESFVAIGISDNAADAESAAAMHALHTLAVLNQKWWIDAPAPGTETESNATGFPPSIAAYAKMAVWPRHNPAAPPRSMEEVGEQQLPPPVRCIGAHVGRVSASGLSADWKRRGQRLHRPSGHFFAEVEDRASEIISNEENTAREILQIREKLPKLAWSLEADAANRIIVAPDATNTDRNYVHTLAAVRQPDLFAVQRLRDYLERHGKNFDSSLAVTQEDSGERGIGLRHVARVQLPLPVKVQAEGSQGPLARCIAQGEAYHQGDAVCMCAMHAELLLDAMGVPLYDHPLLQRRHADTARQLGRWAPLRLGMRPPLAVLAGLPPPLRKEHQGSAVWAAVRQARSEQEKHKTPVAAGAGAEGESSRPAAAESEASRKAAGLRSTAEALKRLQQATASRGQHRGAAPDPLAAATTEKDPTTTTSSSGARGPQHQHKAPAFPASAPVLPSDTNRAAAAASRSAGGPSAGPGAPQTDEELCDISRLQPIHPREVFRQAFKHVQFYFNSKGTDFFRTLRQYTVRDEQHGIVHRAIVEIPLADGFGKRYAVGCAAVKKMAPLLCASHAAWTLDALGIPIYHGRRQHVYATLAKEAGRKAPFPGDQRAPYDTPSPQGLCCLTSASREMPEPPPEPKLEALRRDRRLWMQYLRAARTYIEKKREYDLYEALFELKKAPRWEIPAEDEALDAVELLPLNRQVRAQLPSLCRAAGLPEPEHMRYEIYGKLPQRMFLTEAPVLGTPFTARGVALSGADSTHRAAMHYAYLVSQVVMNNHSGGGRWQWYRAEGWRRGGRSFWRRISADRPQCSRRRPRHQCGGRGGRVASAAGGSGRRLVSNQHLYDVAKADFTAAGKHVLLELFAAIRPPYKPLEWAFKTKCGPAHAGSKGITTSTRKTVVPAGSGADNAGPSTTFVATVEWTDAAEVRHAGRGEHRTDPDEAADAAVADLFRTMLRNASFQGLVAFARRRQEVHLEALFTLEPVGGSTSSSSSSGAELLVDGLEALNTSSGWNMENKSPAPPPTRNDATALIPRGTAVRWRQRLGNAAATAATGPSPHAPSPSLWLQSPAGQLILHALLSTCEQTLALASSSTDGQDDPQAQGVGSIPDTPALKELYRMGLVTLKTNNNNNNSNSNSMYVATATGLAVGLLHQCLPPVSSPTATAGGIRFRHGALLPLQLGKLLYAGLVWDCLPEVTQLIAVMAAGNGTLDSSQHTAVGSEERNAKVKNADEAVSEYPVEAEERENVDVVTLSLEFHRSRVKAATDMKEKDAVAAYAADVTVQLGALQKYLLCALPLDQPSKGPFLSLLEAGLRRVGKQTADAVAESSREVLLRACVAFAGFPSMQPPSTSSLSGKEGAVAASTAATAGLTVSFDAELQLLDASGVGFTRCWALTATVPVVAHLLTTSNTTDPPLTLLEDVPELALMHGSLLLSCCPDKPRPHGKPHHPAADGERLVEELRKLHTRLQKSVFHAACPVPFKIREGILGLQEQACAVARSMPSPTSQQGREEAAHFREQSEASSLSFAFSAVFWVVSENGKRSREKVENIMAIALGGTLRSPRYLLALIVWSFTSFLLILAICSLLRLALVYISYQIHTAPLGDKSIYLEREMNLQLKDLFVVSPADLYRIPPTNLGFWCTHIMAGLGFGHVLARGLSRRKQVWDVVLTVYGLYFFVAAYVIGGVPKATKDYSWYITFWSGVSVTFVYSHRLIAAEELADIPLLPDAALQSLPREAAGDERNRKLELFFPEEVLPRSGKSKCMPILNAHIKLFFSKVTLFFYFFYFRFILYIYIYIYIYSYSFIFSVLSFIKVEMGSKSLFRFFTLRYIRTEQELNKQNDNESITLRHIQFSLVRIILYSYLPHSFEFVGVPLLGHWVELHYRVFSTKSFFFLLKYNASLHCPSYAFTSFFLKRSLRQRDLDWALCQSTTVSRVHRMPRLAAGCGTGVSLSSGVGALLVVSLLLCAQVGTAFYIPGMMPTYHQMGEEVPVAVNSLHSQQSLFPLEFYSLPVCQPDEIQKLHESSLGELFSGDQRLTSLYSVKMLEDVTCNVLPEPCNIESNSLDIRFRVKELEKVINQRYRVGMSIDNLPVHNGGYTYLAMCNADYIKKEKALGFHRGWDLGIPQQCTGESALLNNYLAFTIEYNTNPNNPDEYMIVGLTAVPYSIRFGHDSVACNPKEKINIYNAPPLSLDDIASGEAKVVWAFGVEWVKSDVVWATRWDTYFRSSVSGSKRKAHIVHVIFGTSVVLIISGVVLGLLSRSVFRDLRRYDLVDAVSDMVDAPIETGWKLLHGDVFRPPSRSGLLSILIGNGAQVVGMLLGVLILANFGFLSPSRRGSLITAVLVLTFVMAIGGGFACGYMLSYFRTRDWKYVYLCGTVASGCLVMFLVVADIFYAAHRSTASLSFGVLALLFALWLLVNLPLTVIGAAIAFSFPTVQNPASVNSLSREIPQGSWVSNKYYLCFVPALAPLFTIFLELHFIMQGLWSGQVYYVFGFLTINMILWVFVVGLITVFHLYYLLNDENHRWWWWAFIIPGSCGADMMFYAVYFYLTQLSISSFASTVLYFIYMGIIAVSYGLGAGFIGFVASFVFINVLYRKLRQTVFFERETVSNCLNSLTRSVEKRRCVDEAQKNVCTINTEGPYLPLCIQIIAAILVYAPLSFLRRYTLEFIEPGEYASFQFRELYFYFYLHTLLLTLSIGVSLLTLQEKTLDIQLFQKHIVLFNFLFPLGGDCGVALTLKGTTLTPPKRNRRGENSATVCIPLTHFIYCLSCWMRITRSNATNGKPYQHHKHSPASLYPPAEPRPNTARDYICRPSPRPISSTGSGLPLPQSPSGSIFYLPYSSQYKSTAAAAATASRHGVSGVGVISVPIKSTPGEHNSNSNSSSSSSGSGSGGSNASIPIATTPSIVSGEGGQGGAGIPVPPPLQRPGAGLAASAQQRTTTPLQEPRRPATSSHSHSSQHLHQELNSLPPPSTSPHLKANSSSTGFRFGTPPTVQYGQQRAPPPLSSPTPSHASTAATGVSRSGSSGGVAGALPSYFSSDRQRHTAGGPQRRGSPQPHAHHQQQLQQHHQQRTSVTIFSSNNPDALRFHWDQSATPSSTTTSSLGGNAPQRSGSNSAGRSRPASGSTGGRRTEVGTIIYCPIEMQRQRLQQAAEAEQQQQQQQQLTPPPQAASGWPPSPAALASLKSILKQPRPSSSSSSNAALRGRTPAAVIVSGGPSTPLTPSPVPSPRPQSAYAWRVGGPGNGHMAHRRVHFDEASLARAGADRGRETTPKIYHDDALGLSWDHLDVERLLEGEGEADAADHTAQHSWGPSRAAESSLRRTTTTSSRGGGPAGASAAVPFLGTAVGSDTSPPRPMPVTAAQPASVADLGKTVVLPKSRTPPPLPLPLSGPGGSPGSAPRFRAAAADWGKDSDWFNEEFGLSGKNHSTLQGTNDSVLAPPTEDRMLHASGTTSSSSHLLQHSGTAPSVLLSTDTTTTTAGRTIDSSTSGGRRTSASVPPPAPPMAVDELMIPSTPRSESELSSPLSSTSFQKMALSQAERSMLRALVRANWRSGRVGPLDCRPSPSDAPSPFIGSQSTASSGGPGSGCSITMPCVPPPTPPRVPSPLPAPGPGILVSPGRLSRASSTSSSTSSIPPNHCSPSSSSCGTGHRRASTSLISGAGAVVVTVSDPNSTPKLRPRRASVSWDVDPRDKLRDQSDLELSDAPRPRSAIPKPSPSTLSGEINPPNILTHDKMNDDELFRRRLLWQDGCGG
eukprot:gene476-256_t